MHYQKRLFPTLDGWRALSVIGVVLYHGRFGFFPNDDSIFARISSHGHVGVDIFFAISGFLICGLLLREQRREEEVARDDREDRHDDVRDGRVEVRADLAARARR